MWLPRAYDGGLNMPGADPFDPRHFTEFWRGTQFLPLGDSCNAPFVLLDYEDYQWARRWLWSWTTSKRGRLRKHKVYARRNTVEGSRATVRYQVWRWLHKEICERAHGPPPTLFHTIADHIDGDTLNCRRSNLRWATPAENRANINGQAIRQAAAG